MQKGIIVIGSSMSMIFFAILSVSIFAMFYKAQMSASSVFPTLAGGNVGGNTPSRTQAPMPVCDHKFARPGWEYVRRVQQTTRDGKTKKAIKIWKCPVGYEDNGCSWDNGSIAGELQCRKRVSQGRWESPMYGGSGGKPFKEECAPGHYVSGVTIFSNASDTNALFAQCYDPTGVIAPYPLFKSATDNIYGKYDKPAGGAEWLKKIITAGAAGDVSRKSYGNFTLNDVVQGFYKWEVNAQKRKKSLEVRGLKMYGRDGRDTGWAGGTAGTEGNKTVESVLTGTDLPFKAESGQCPNGKVITGIQGRAGDRLDAIGFICDAPRT